MNDLYIIPPAQISSLAIEGDTRRFPVRRIFCVGRNYAEHTQEMGGNPQDEPPIFFTKPADTLVESGATIPYPPATSNLHYEAELVVALGAGGKNISEDDAHKLILGYAAGNDLTRRDIQAQAKKAGQPWDMAKGFDRSAVVGAIRVGEIGDLTLSCSVAGELKQKSQLSEMIWSVDQIISRLSALVELCAGDLIFTGTPAGVGSLVSGQTCTVQIGDLPKAVVTIA